MSVVLRAARLAKRYTVRPDRSLILGLRRGAGPRRFWALRNVDLEVSAGEVFAVIGRNGAGKTTLLRLAAGVTAPTRGDLMLPGRVAPLIEIGAGLHPELSGRENVLLNGRLLGQSRSEVARSLDAIIGWAELEHAVDQPVKQYSSGMLMRLAFSISTATQPELLVVDEVLAVGDLGFQLRCLDRITSMRNAGTGVLLVTHDLASAASLATRAMLLVDGAPAARGPVDEVVAAYRASVEQPGAIDPVALGIDAADDQGAVVVGATEVVSAARGAVTRWQPGERVRVTASVSVRTALADSRFGFMLLTMDGIPMASWSDEAASVGSVAAGQTVTVQTEFDLNVAAGAYQLHIALWEGARAVVPGSWRSLHVFEVDARPWSFGPGDVRPTVSLSEGV